MKAFLKAVSLACSLAQIVLSIAAIVLIVKNWPSDNDSTSPLDNEP